MRSQVEDRLLAVDKIRDRVTRAEVVFTAQNVKTGADGIAKFDNLKVGIYKVTEKTNGNYTVAAPFLVTLPLTQDGELNYNPTVSPKNQKLDPTKAADDANANIGDEITYTVKAPVPAGDVLQDGTRTISQFRITDDLQKELTYVADSAAVTLIGAKDGVDASLQSGDYTITNNGQNLTVEFTEAGLQRWLAALIVGVVVAIIGFFLVRKGQNNLSASRLTPERTAANVRKDLNLVKEQVSS